MKKKRINIGKILKPHNLKGECVLNTSLHLDDLKALLLHKPLLIQKQNQEKQGAIIISIRSHKDNFLICLKDINSRDQVSDLNGALVFAQKDLFRTKKGETFF